MKQEQYCKLLEEAAAFFADAKADRAETRAMQKEALRTFGSDLSLVRYGGSLEMMKVTDRRKGGRKAGGRRRGGGR